MDGSQKLPAAPARHRRATGRAAEPTPRVGALGRGRVDGVRRLAARTAHGRLLPLDDPLADHLREAAGPGSDPATVATGLLGVREVFGEDLRDSSVFRDAADPPPEGAAVKIVAADVIVTSPDRNFVTLRITTDDGLIGLGDATLNGRELAVASYLRDHVVPLLHRAGRAPHRGHLAVPLPLGVLAARAGDDGGHRRGRRGAVGHQGQGRRDAALPAARRREPDRVLAYGHASAGTLPSCSTRSARTSSWATARSGCRPSVPGINAVYGVAAQPTREGDAVRLRAGAAGRRCRPRRTGTPAPTCGTSRRSSRRSATSSAPSCRCCTTPTTG